MIDREAVIDKTLMMNNSTTPFEVPEPDIPLKTMLAVLLAYVLGVALAVVILPAWSPALAQSLIGDSPKAYWFLARTSAFAAFGLLWLSMVFGLLLTNKLAQLWPGGPIAINLHQYTSLLGLGFGLFHALILLGDHYIGYTLPQLLIPFAGQSYEPMSVGMGQIAFYGMALVTFSYYIRRLISKRGWRLLHFASFGVMALALIHGITSGTDSGTPWAQALYWFCGGSVFFLTLYRILIRQPTTTTAASTTVTTA